MRLEEILPVLCQPSVQRAEFNTTNLMKAPDQHLPKLINAGLVCISRLLRHGCIPEVQLVFVVERNVHDETITCTGDLLFHEISISHRQQDALGNRGRLGRLTELDSGVWMLRTGRFYEFSQARRSASTSNKEDILVFRQNSA